MSDLDLFAGAGGVGVRIQSSLANPTYLGLAILTPATPSVPSATNDTRTWLAVTAISGPIAGRRAWYHRAFSDVHLNINKASGDTGIAANLAPAQPINWATAFDHPVNPGAALASPVDLTITLDTGVLEVRGTVDTLDVLGVATIKGGFDITTQKVDVDVNHNGLFSKTAR